MAFYSQPFVAPRGVPAYVAPGTYHPRMGGMAGGGYYNQPVGGGRGLMRPVNSRGYSFFSLNRYTIGGIILLLLIGYYFYNMYQKAQREKIAQQYFAQQKAQQQRRNHYRQPQFYGGGNMMGSGFVYRSVNFR